MRYLIPVHLGDCWTFVSDPSLSPGGTTSYLTTIIPSFGDNVGHPYSTPSHGGKLGHSLVNPIHPPQEGNMGGHIQPPSEGKWANYTGSEIHIMIPPWRLCILTNNIRPLLGGTWETTFTLHWRECGPLPSEVKYKLTTFTLLWRETG